VGGCKEGGQNNFSVMKKEGDFVRRSSSIRKEKKKGRRSFLFHRRGGETIGSSGSAGEKERVNSFEEKEKSLSNRYPLLGGAKTHLNWRKKGGVHST